MRPLPAAVTGTPKRSRTRKVNAAALAVVVAHDALAFAAARPAARTATRFIAAGVLLALARAEGVSWPELGLAPQHAAGGARAGAAAGAVAATVVIAAAALPATRPFFLDERAAAAGADTVIRELGRITLATVLPEELAYRGALLGLWAAHGSERGAVVRSSALFGTSHVLPTLATLSGSVLHPHTAGRPVRRLAVVAANVTVTAAAGAGLAWLRLRSRSILAPLLAHAALNAAAFAAGRVAHRLGAPHRSVPVSRR